MTYGEPAICEGFGGVCRDLVRSVALGSLKPIIYSMILSGGVCDRDIVRRIGREFDVYVDPKEVAAELIDAERAGILCSDRVEPLKGRRAYFPSSRNSAGMIREKLGILDATYEKILADLDTELRGWEGKIGGFRITQRAERDLARELWEQAIDDDHPGRGIRFPLFSEPDEKFSAFAVYKCRIPLALSAIAAKRTDSSGISDAIRRDGFNPDKNMVLMMLLGLMPDECSIIRPFLKQGRSGFTENGTLAEENYEYQMARGARPFVYRQLKDFARVQEYATRLVKKNMELADAQTEASVVLPHESRPCL